VHGSACFLMRRLGPHPKCIYFCFCITNADKQACVFRARNGSLNVACMSPRGTCWVRLGEAGAGDELLQGWGRTASPELHLQDGLREGTAGHQANSCVGEKQGGGPQAQRGTLQRDQRPLYQQPQPTPLDLAGSDSWPLPRLLAAFLSFIRVTAPR
jgi:hypothetical protein